MFLHGEKIRILGAATTVHGVRVIVPTLTKLGVDKGRKC